MEIVIFGLGSWEHMGTSCTVKPVNWKTMTKIESFRSRIMEKRSIKRFDRKCVKLKSCDEDVRILAVGKLISPNIFNERCTGDLNYMYMSEVKTKPLFYKRCTCWSIVYTKDHVYKIGCKVMKFEAFYMDGNKQNGEQAKKWGWSDVVQKWKRRVFLYIFLQGRFIIVFGLTYEKFI